LSVNVTLPARVAFPAAATIVAVIVTDSLMVEGLAEEANVNDVVACPTVWLTIAWLEV
jgi:hypothetical protein